MKEVEDTGSFLKLTQAKNWSAGIEEVAPRNLNAAAEVTSRVLSGSGSSSVWSMFSCILGFQNKPKMQVWCMFGRV